MTLASIVFLIVFLFLIVIGIIGCIRECKQAGKYDGR
ncbi:hypothetical protein QFZ34_002110 [Phyllobacterium ifriqiyense]|uniref:Uncharacterized protein n=1 Tax=Phyllobacterium ifriqiyense TaxID=314238 RepID=A0ABU0S843_9HYPH|nr:hypothetical protein [Phyllobacterium ifriqiyense]